MAIVATLLVYLLRLYALDVEVEKGYMYRLLVCAVEQVVTLCVAGIQSREVGRCKRAIRSHSTLENKAANCRKKQAVDYGK